MLKEKIFSQIKLKYFGSDKEDKKPIHAGVICSGCGAVDIVVGQSSQQPGEDKPRFFCEDCAIDAFQKDHDFSSREAAASLRRREFDIFYLFVEIMADNLIAKGALPPAEEMSKKDLNKLMDFGREFFNLQFSKHCKFKLASMDKQKDIEAYFRKILKQSDPQDSINLSFSRDEFVTLITMIYLGDWMANATRDPNEWHGVFKKMLRKVFSHAREIGLGAFFDDPRLEDKAGYGGPSSEFHESGIHELIEEYDEDTFWEELIDRMSVRDFFRTYSSESIAAMDWKERFERQDPFEKKYNDEFSDYGLERLEIVKKEE